MSDNPAGHAAGAARQEVFVNTDTPGVGGFFAQVYNIVRRIPPGRVATYGQVARLTGNPRAARQVGWALHVNPRPGEIPCHRVVNRFGACSGSFAFGGQDAQRRLLEKEGVTFDGDGRADLREYLWNGEEFPL